MQDTGPSRSLPTSPSAAKASLRLLEKRRVAFCSSYFAWKDHRVPPRMPERRPDGRRKGEALPIVSVVIPQRRPFYLIFLRRLMSIPSYLWISSPHLLDLPISELRAFWSWWYARPPAMLVVKPRRNIRCHELVESPWGSQTVRTRVVGRCHAHHATMSAIPHVDALNVLRLHCSRDLLFLISVRTSLVFGHFSLYRKPCVSRIALRPPYFRRAMRGEN